MESLGEKLKTSRIEKGFSFDQISRDTNISLRYLEALEAENFGIFPGEPYVIGFLKNYGAYLELDVQKIISLYRALKIQEQPIPVEQLLRHKPKLPIFLLPVVLILAVAGGAGYGIYFLITHVQLKRAENIPIVRKPTEYVMERRPSCKNAATLPCRCCSLQNPLPLCANQEYRRCSGLRWHPGLSRGLRGLPAY